MNKALPIERISFGWRAEIMAFATGLFEPIEILKDFLYIKYFPHYSWWTMGILILSLYYSTSFTCLHIWGNTLKKDNPNGFWEELNATFFERENRKR